MTSPYPHGGASPYRATRSGDNGMAVPAGASDSGALSSSLRASGPDATTHGTRVGASNPERTRACAHSYLPVGTAAASKDAPVSDVAGFSAEILKAERLVLLMDAHRARKRHASVKGIMRRLRAVTARLAMIGA